VSIDFYKRSHACFTVAMDALDEFSDVSLSDHGLRQKSTPHPSPPDPWKVILCVLLDARVYLKGVAQSVMMRAASLGL